MVPHYKGLPAQLAFCVTYIPAQRAAIAKKYTLVIVDMHQSDGNRQSLLWPEEKGSITSLAGKKRDQSLL